MRKFYNGYKIALKISSFFLMFEEHLGVITDFFKYEQTLSASFKMQIQNLADWKDRIYM